MRRRQLRHCKIAAARQSIEDAPAGRVGERREDRVQLLVEGVVLILNHVV